MLIMEQILELNHNQSLTKNTLSLFAFFRTKDWLHILGLIFLGHAYSWDNGPFFRLSLALLIGGLYLAHGYTLNDIHDGQIKISISRAAAFSLSLLALFFCLVLSRLISISTLFIVAAGHLSGFLYSAPPLRLKNKLWLDLIFNSLALSPLFLLGSAINNEPSLTIWAVFGLIFLYFIPIQLIHQIQDKAIDITSGQKNTFQILGIEKTKNIISITLILYAFTNLFLWKLRVFSIFSALCGITFSCALLLYMPAIKDKAMEKDIQKDTLNKNIKSDARHISIAYGLILLLSFWLQH